MVRINVRNGSGELSVRHKSSNSSYTRLAMNPVYSTSETRPAISIDLVIRLNFLRIILRKTFRSMVHRGSAKKSGGSGGVAPSDFWSVCICKHLRTQRVTYRYAR